MSTHCDTLPTLPPPGLCTCAEPLPAPEDMAVAAAWRLLELQAQDAAGWPAPTTTDYEASLYARPPVDLALEDAREALESGARKWLPALGPGKLMEGYYDPASEAGLGNAQKTGRDADRVAAHQQTPLGDPTPRAIRELMEYRRLLRVFEDARDDSPPGAGGWWWALRMDGRLAKEVAAEVGQPTADVRAGALTYEAAIISGLARTHG